MDSIQMQEITPLYMPKAYTPMFADKHTLPQKAAHSHKFSVKSPVNTLTGLLSHLHRISIPHITNHSS